MNQLVGSIYLRDSLRSCLRLKVHPGEMKNTAVSHSGGMNNHASECGPNEIVQRAVAPAPILWGTLRRAGEGSKADLGTTPRMNTKIGKREVKPEQLLGPF